MDRAGFGVRAARGGEGVNDEIDRSHVARDHGKGLLLDGFRESIAIDILGVITRRAGRPGESDGVIPTGGSWTPFFGRTLIKNPESRRA